MMKINLYDTAICMNKRLFFNWASMMNNNKKTSVLPFNTQTSVYIERASIELSLWLKVEQTLRKTSILGAF